MAAMISGPKRRAAASLLACVAATSGVGGCAGTIGGAAVKDGASLDTIPLPELMLEPSDFPPDYPAAWLDGTAARGALAMIDGVPPGGRVTPADCQPPAPTEIAAAEAVRDETTLRVVLTRGAGPLSTRAQQVGRCSSFSVATDASGSWDVTADMLPPPVLNVDDAFAVEQRQTDSATAGGLTLVGQVGEVRVMAQLTGPPGQELDTVVLDGVFTAAVQKVRRAV
jgi:hypothetical protein